MKYDNFLWIAMFFSIGYFVIVKPNVEWSWYYWILGVTISIILLGFYFHGKSKWMKNENKSVS